MSFRVFRCTVFIHDRLKGKSKLNPRAIKVFSLDILLLKRVYKSYDLCTNRAFVGLDVTFKDTLITKSPQLRGKI